MWLLRVSAWTWEAERTETTEGRGGHLQEMMLNNYMHIHLLPSVILILTCLLACLVNSYTLDKQPALSLL